jgi:uronate dehydrogenase
MNDPRRILVTGAAGLVATALRPFLRERYEEVVLTDLRPVIDLEAGEEFFEGNLEDLGFVKGVCQGVDAILHLGGLVGAHYTFEEVLGPNIVGTHHVFEAAVENGIRRVVFASSHHAVGFTPRGEFIDHRTRPRPNGEYGVSKAYGEAAASYFVDNFDLEILSIRIGYVGREVSTERRLHTWISPRDLAELIHIGFTVPNLGHEIVYGVSEVPDPFFENSNATRLGYRPRDRAVDHVTDPALLTEHPDATTIEGGVIGGGFASAGFAGDPHKVLKSS